MPDTAGMLMDLHRPNEAEPKIVAQIQYLSANVRVVETKIDETNRLLKRLVEIEEERVAIDKANAMILSGVMGEQKQAAETQGFEDYRESVGERADGQFGLFEVLRDGEWVLANAVETAEIRAMNENRKRRR